MSGQKLPAAEAFEAYLSDVCKEDQSRTGQAMEYALMAGGKRVRPRLLFGVLEDYQLDPAAGFPAAAAIEMVHTYSLVHDDLPAMDDDDLRRGCPTCHKAFDEATAILAGDALLTKAFLQAVKSQCSPEQKVRLVETLSSLSGVQGMIYGQELDMQSEGKADLSMEDLDAIEAYKTGCLLTAPLVMGAILAGKEQDIDTWKTIGRNLGLAFQIQDDILEVTSTQEKMGKSLSDKDNDKITAVSLLGLEKAQKRADALFEQIDEDLNSLHLSGTKTRELIEWLKSRDH